QLNIPNAKKSDKQDLIYKILDKQATSSNGKQNGTEKPTRKRIVKAATANASEEAEVMTDSKESKNISPEADEKESKPKKRGGRKLKEKEQPEQEQSIEEEKPEPDKEEISDLDIPEMGSRLLSLL